MFLTSDDKGMRRIAQHYGVETIDRPPHLAGTASRSRPSCSTATPRYAGGSARRRKRGRAARECPDRHERADRPGRENAACGAGLDAVIRRERPWRVSPVCTPLRSRPMAGCGARRGEAAAIDAEPVYFPDALLWVMRPAAVDTRSGQGQWLAGDVESSSVAGLVHEGYGDVDHAWQIPFVEEWLRRRGFDDTRTPYDVASSKGRRRPWRGRSPRRGAASAAGADHHGAVRRRAPAARVAGERRHRIRDQPDRTPPQGGRAVEWPRTSAYDRRHRADHRESDGRGAAICG